MNDEAPGADTGSSLKNIELFKSLDDAALGEVARLISWRIYPKDTEIIPHMGQGDDVFFIASGSVRVTIYSFAGKEISYEELGSGATFGELSAIDRQPRTANVITLEEARIGRISAGNYWSLVNRYPAVAAAALIRLAGIISTAPSTSRIGSERRFFGWQITIFPGRTALEFPIFRRTRKSQAGSIRTGRQSPVS